MSGSSIRSRQYTTPSCTTRTTTPNLMGSLSASQMGEVMALCCVCVGRLTAVVLFVPLHKPAVPYARQGVSAASSFVARCKCHLITAAGGPQRAQLTHTNPTGTACTTWSATCGSGWRTGGPPTGLATRATTLAVRDTGRRSPRRAAASCACAVRNRVCRCAGRASDGGSLRFFSAVAADHRREGFRCWFCCRCWSWWVLVLVLLLVLVLFLLVLLVATDAAPVCASLVTTRVQV